MNLIILHTYLSLVVAMSFEAIGNHESCLKIYQRTVELLKDRQPIKDLTLVEWAEEALHRAIQLVSNHTFRYTHKA